MTQRGTVRHPDAPIGPYVPGRGRDDADIMLIGEAPGMQEEMMRKCWVGKAGKELARYLKQAGIDIRDCWLTNLVKHRPTTRSKSGNVKPTAVDIKRDEGELVDEIERVRPTFVVSVGAVSTRWFLGSKMTMEIAHGLPWPAALCLNCGRRFHGNEVDRQPSSKKPTQSNTKDAKLLALDGSAGQKSIRGDPISGKDAVRSPSDVHTASRRDTERVNTGSSLREDSMCQPETSRTSNIRRKRTQTFPKTDKVPKRSCPNSRESTDPQCAEQAMGSQKGRRMSGLQARSKETTLEQTQRTDQCCPTPETHSFIVIAALHPASGLHAPESQPLIFWDFQQAGKYVRGTLPCVTPRDLYPDPDYYEPRQSVQLVKSLPIAVDTEGLAGRVWGLSFSQFGGSAGVIRATNRRAIASMKEQLLR